MDPSQHGHMGMAQFPVGGKSGMGIQNILYFRSNIIFILLQQRKQPTNFGAQAFQTKQQHPAWHGQNAGCVTKSVEFYSQNKKKH